MKVLLCDVDGVLNSREFFLSLKDPPLEPADRISEDLVSRLNVILDETVAVPILSSSWRHMGHLPVLNSMFVLKGLRHPFAGKTPWLGVGVPRGEEIQAWLDKHTEVENFVILDDDLDFGEKMIPHLIHVDPKHGLQDADVKKAIAMLNKTSDQLSG